MKVIYRYHDELQIKGSTGVGLGNFDGLHIGHMALINTLINECKLEQLESVVYTFMKHPENILRKSLITPLLTSMDKKVELLSETPLDYLCFDEFDESFSRMKPEDFVKEILIDKLKIRLAVAGFDYRFGYKGQGDIQLLKELGKEYRFKVVIIPPVKLEDEVISSTLIRACVSKGKMGKVFKLLARHYSIKGKVEHGNRIGNKIGFPTANINPKNYLVLPKEGVYITKTCVDGVLYNSITNVGRNPTFGKLEKVRVETNILDFGQEIYGKDIEVFFISKVRGEKKFKSQDALVQQMKKDIACAREYFVINGSK